MNNLNSTTLILEKPRSEKIFEWIKFAVKALIFIFFIVAITWASDKSSDFWKTRNINTKIVWKFNEEVSEQFDVDSIAWIKINWIIANRNLWFGDWLVDSEMIMHMLEMASKDNKIKLIVLEIDSPWWTVIDSDKISNKINEVKKSKKVYALLESVAASWWYYIASQCDKIFAYDETITWSIWVIVSIPNLTKLADKIWLEQISITSWEFKDMWNPLKPMDAKTRNLFQKMVDDSYSKFIKIVWFWRNIAPEKIKTIADWRIYSWKQAKELKLIDSTEWKDWLLSDVKKIIPNFNILLFEVKKTPLEEFLMPMWSIYKSFLWIDKWSSKIQLMYLLN